MSHCETCGGVLSSLRQGQQTQVCQGQQRPESGLPGHRLPAPPPIFQQPRLNRVVRPGERPSSMCTCTSGPRAPGRACWRADSDPACLWQTPCHNFSIHSVRGPHTCLGSSENNPDSWAPPQRGDAALSPTGSGLQSLESHYPGSPFLLCPPRACETWAQVPNLAAPGSPISQAAVSTQETKHVARQVSSSCPSSA